MSELFAKSSESNRIIVMYTQTPLSVDQPPPNKSGVLFNVGSTKPLEIFWPIRFVCIDMHSEMLDLWCVPKCSTFEVKLATATSTTPCQPFQEF